MLKVSGLTVSFGGKKVVSEVSFNLNQGEILGFVGESGSGKSITALALMGLLPPNAIVEQGKAILETESGSIDVFKIDSRQHQKLRGGAMAMIFQEPQTSLNPSMRCGKQIDEAVLLHTTLRGKAIRERSIELLTEMQLPNPEKIYNSFPHQLSGGQKQRVMIAIALAGNPKLLIADEPTTALDVTVQKEILKLLRDIRDQRDISIIFISHDLAVVSEVADNIMVLKQGEIVEKGTVLDIFSNPKHPYTKNLIGFRQKLNNLIGLSHTYKTTPLISFKSVSIEYASNSWFREGFRAVKDVSFDIFEGETLGLVGESGSGKSSIGRALLGLTSIKSGQIRYKGLSIDTLKGKDRLRFCREVQIVFQDPYSSLNPRLTIGQALMEPIIYHRLGTLKQARRRVIELLDVMQLAANSINRYPHEFSGGQRQRIVIARVLALNPKVLVCDEILSALDVSTQAQMIDLLIRLKEEFNLTYLFISHDLSLVKSFCNRVVVLNKGMIEEQGLAQEVFGKPQSIYTQKLIDSIPAIST